VPLQASAFAIAAGLIAAAGILCGSSRSSRSLTAADTIAALALVWIDPSGSHTSSGREK
jgi:hypothetical protein